MPTSSPSSIPDELPPARESSRPGSFAAVPGWVVSGMLHAGVIVFLVTSGLPSCGDGQLGTGADHGEFRDVGIYIKQSAEAPTPPKETEVEKPQEPQMPVANPTVQEPAKVAEAVVSNLIDIPEVPQRATIGQSRGAPAEIGGTPNVTDALVTPNEVYTPQAQGLGPGNVSFMGKTAEAQSVVYVIDTSSSMRNHNAIEFAQARLKQSINGLGQTQKFQIIPYAHAYSVMHLRNDRPETAPLYPAIGPNVTLAMQYINSLEASGGTKHFPPLMHAFKYQPDVIFFLTDADEDRLSPRDLADIRTVWNKHRKTHIHCIKFGSGPELTTANSNFLKILATENGGSYTYLDVNKLDAR